MKVFNITKVGYTAGVYGCSNEYFLLTYVNDEGMHFEYFYGLYGPEERTRKVMNDLGYKEYWHGQVYGKLVRNDIPKNIVSSETELINRLQETK